MKTFRLHIDNSRRQDATFHVTPERYEAAASAYPSLAQRIEPSFGWDGDVFQGQDHAIDCIMGWRFPREAILPFLPDLRWIHVTGAGVEHLMPLDWLPETIPVTTNSGVHAEKAAEYVTMSVLALNNHLPFFNQNKVEQRWQQRFSTRVCGKTIVILGTGSMGQAGAQACKALGMITIGVSRSGAARPGFDEVVTSADLHLRLPKADFLLSALPLTPDTRRLIDIRELDLLPAHCGIINIGRAGVMNYEELFLRLRAGRLDGAILDVFEQEPLPRDTAIWSVPNLIMTPHVSSDDANHYAKGTADLFFRNFARYERGEPLLNLIDRSLQY